MNTAPVPNIRPAMNPGMIVAGGGGDGGGSGAGGKGSGGGKVGAGNGTGEGSPEGGGKGGDDCGAGANGACTNCGTQISRGDPFDVTTGEVFTVPAEDLFLPGTFALKLLRKYMSSCRDFDMGLGWGWTHTLGWSLVRQDGKLLIRTGDGRRVTLPDPDEKEGQYSNGVWSVLKTRNYYAVDPGTEFIHLFSQLDGPDSPFLLTSVVYRKRGCLSLDYERGQLCRVTDTVGRTVRIHRSPEGRIGSIDVPSDHGDIITFARFEYDSFGHLLAATDAEGATTQYGYDESHLLTRLTYANGVTFHFVYDQQGRCIETWGAGQVEPDPALSESVPKILADGRTPAKGIYHCRTDYVDDEYVEVTDSIRLQRFFAGPGGQIAKAVSARGGVTERVFDKYGYVASQTDPTGATWRWERDQAGRILKETSPEGQVFRTTFDEGGRGIEVIDPEGGTTTIQRDDWGEIEWVRDQNDAYLVFGRDDRAQIITTIDERSGRWVFQYDDHGNCTAQTFPTGASYHFGYDHWGRLTSVTTPTGSAARYSYTPGGRVREVTSFDGQVTRYRYDAMGKVAATIYPDGTATYLEYAGHHWLHRVTHPDGSQINVRRNREGWIDYLENERGEQHTFTYDLDGSISEERDFIGLSHRYTYDELGRLATQDDGQGVHEYAYDRIGRLLSHTAPDGASRTFKYNRRGELIEAVSDNVTMRWTRGKTGEILREEFCFDDATYAVDSERDLGGARLKLTSSIGYEVVVRRNPNGGVVELWADGDQTLRLTRDAEGRVVRRDFSHGGGVVTEYDVQGRIKRTEVVSPGSSATNRLEPEWVGEHVPGRYGRIYDYTILDEVSRVATSEGVFTEYQYDARHRLTSAKHSDGTTERFRNDATSNHTEDGPDAPSRVFGRGSQLQAFKDWEYSYDAEGRLQGKRARLRDGSHGKWWRYDYNGFGFLKSVSRPDGLRVEFEYDAYARRVKKTVTQDGELVKKIHFVWDLVTLLHEITFTPDAATPTVRTYLYEDNHRGTPLGHRDGGADARFIHYINDVSGYPQDFVNPSGHVVARMDRYVYGEPKLAREDTVPTAIRFSGQYADEETGLTYNRYRYYDPAIGRYITPDPIGIRGAMNLYGYATNPVGWVDPMGWRKHHVVVDTDGDEALAANLAQRLGEEAKGSTVSKTSGGEGTPQGIKDALHGGCTEQQISGALIDMNRENPGCLKDKKIKVTGEYPPCPNCHAAMMRAAHETGADIKYEWPKGNATNAITYNGSTKKPPTFNDGDEAQMIAGTYSQHQLDPGEPGAFGGPTARPTHPDPNVRAAMEKDNTPAHPGGYPDWGVQHGAGSQAACDEAQAVNDQKRKKANEEQAARDAEAKRARDEAKQARKDEEDRRRAARNAAKNQDKQ